MLEKTIFQWDGYTKIAKTVIYNDCKPPSYIFATPGIPFNKAEPFNIEIRVKVADFWTKSTAIFCNNYTEQILASGFQKCRKYLDYIEISVSVTILSK